MSLFDKPVDCNKCGAQFAIDDSRIASIKEGDLEVQYFSCPSCGAKYPFFVTDSKMRELVRQRKDVQTKIKAARAKRFQERTFKKYMKEYEKIKKAQEEIFPELQARGEKILNGERGEPNAAAELHDQS